MLIKLLTSKVTNALTGPVTGNNWGAAGISWLFKSVFATTGDQTFADLQEIDTVIEGRGEGSEVAIVTKEPTRTDPFIKISGGRIGKGSLSYFYEYLRTTFTSVTCGTLCKMNDEIILSDARNCRSNLYSSINGVFSLTLERGVFSGTMSRQLKIGGTVIGEVMSNYVANDIDHVAWIFGGQNSAGDFGIGAAYTHGLTIFIMLHGATKYTIGARFMGDTSSGGSMTTLSAHAWSAGGAIRAYADYFHAANGDAVTKGMITPYFVDNFNGTNGDDIVADHSPDTGADWTYITDGFTIENNELVPKANNADILGDAGSGSFFCAYTSHTEYVGASNYGLWYVYVRYQDGSNNWRVQLNSGNGTMSIFERVSAVDYERSSIVISSLDKIDNVEYSATFRIDGNSINVTVKAPTQTVNLNYTSASTFSAETAIRVRHWGTGTFTLRGMKIFALLEIGNDGEYSAIGDYVE